MSVLGIDGGGTKTLAVQVARSGAVELLVEAPGLDPTRTADPGAELAAFLARFAPPEAATVGLPFFDEVAAITEMQCRATTARFGAGGRACNDVDMAHVGAFGGGDGVLCLAGTGSMAWARGPAGSARAGGFGDLMGDEGSAFWIGQQGLIAAARQIDGRDAATDFAPRLCARLGTAPGEIIDLVYSQPNPRVVIAGIAAQISALAADGQAEAAAILRAAAGELAEAVRAAAHRAGLTGAEPWAHAGGAFKDPILRAELARILGSEPVPGRLPPVGGAALDAALRAGWPAGETWIATLRGGLAAKGVA